MKEKISGTCCFTGYRPSKFPFSLNYGDPDFGKFENALSEQVLKLAEEGCGTFYCGMAMGFDIIAAETVISVKNGFSEPLKLVCVLPFKNQGEEFSGDWKKRFYRVLDAADSVEILADNYYPGCYSKRNRFMVDSSDYVITWYDGKSGGTKNTIDYAIKRGRKVFNVNEDCCDTSARQLEFEIMD